MQLYSRTYGSTGPHVIILHGLFGMSDNWHQVARDLSSSYRVHALDLRNHGRSPHDPVMTYDAMAADVVEYLEAHAIPAAVLVGHSMGGKVAMHVALHHADLLLGLVVVDISPRAYEDRHDDVFDAFCSFPIATVTSRNEAAEIMTRLVGAESTANFLLKNLKRKGGAGFEWKIPIGTIRDNYRHIIGETSDGVPYEGPTLFLRGEKAHYLLPADNPLLERLFPSFAMDTIFGAGHWVHVDNPAGFRHSLSDFLANALS